MSARDYYLLTKPGIIRGNMLTAAAGFFLAAKGHVNWYLLLATLAGIALIIASACVCNNYIDRDIDAKMSRTKRRAMVLDLISRNSALSYAFILGLAGFVVLAVLVNLLTVILGAAAFLVYVVLYGISKRRGTYGTLVGSIAGALPPVAGYMAVTNHLDGAAILLFLILICWQMPHFYAIALYRHDDYANAGIPVLPVARGSHPTKIQILIYIIAFMIAAVALTIFGYTGYVYLTVVSLLGVGWLSLGLKGFRVADDRRWARKMFLFSLIVITLLSLAISVDSLLP